MTISPEEISGRPGPRYRAIADALAEDIVSGDLAPGARLPTHRDLAWKIGVTVGTVTRAYAELERRGIVQGEVGRGTFVGGSGPEDLIIPVDEPGDGVIDLSRSYPAPGAQIADLPRALREIADDPGSGRLLTYQDHAGRPEHRAAGADWIGRSGYDMSPDRVIVTAGAQHSLVVAHATVLAPGERLAIEALSFPGIKVVARMFGSRLEPLAMDGEGALPEAVDAACRSGVRTLCCVPNLQNPTNTVMPLDRRKAIAEIVREHGAFLIEDDIFGLLREDPLPPIACFAPENVLYLTSLSKTVAPGLRIGYLVVPPALLERARAAVRATCWMTPPLMAEIATRWINDGTAARILAQHQETAADRMALALDILGPWEPVGVSGALHIWFHLPSPWTTTAFVAAARDRGVLLTTEAPFVVPGSEAPQALRICLGPPASQDVLESALRRVAEILRTGPEPSADLSIV